VGDRDDATFPVIRIDDGPRGPGSTLAVAGLVVVALVGLSLLSDARAADEGPDATATAAPPGAGGPVSTSLAPLRLFPPPGALDIGWHNLTVAGSPFAVNIPVEGWTSHGSNAARNGGRLAKGARGTAGGAVIEFWSPDHVYTDPCGQAPSPTIGPLASDLARAIADLPGVEVSGPFDVTVAFGPPVQHLVVEVPDEVACESRSLRLWYDSIAGPRLPVEPGSTILVWIANWTGPSAGAARILVEAETYADASRDLELEVASIVGSMVSNRHAPDPPRLGIDDDARRVTVEQIESICRSATLQMAALESRSGAGSLWLDAATRIADETLAELRAVPPPERDEVALDGLLNLLEPPIDALRQAAAAAARGDARALETLLHEQARLTSEKDWRVSFDSGGWPSLAASLRSCPAANGGQQQRPTAD
jgi:hypothetical protein